MFAGDSVAGGRSAGANVRRRAPIDGRARAMLPSPPMPRLERVTLEGRYVRMEPLDLSRHWDGLLAIGLDQDLWAHTLAKVKTEALLRGYLETALAEEKTGTVLPFATVHVASGRVAGSTRFANWVAEHRRAEIGWTWVGREFQRTVVNTEAKYLMFRHAFETLGLRRVELKTALSNERSQAAMTRLGLVREGVFRQHMINEDGSNRDSVYFSIIDGEWPAMKARLEGWLERR